MAVSDSLPLQSFPFFSFRRGSFSILQKLLHHCPNSPFFLFLSRQEMIRISSAHIFPLSLRLFVVFLSPFFFFRLIMIRHAIFPSFLPQTLMLFDRSFYGVGNFRCVFSTRVEFFFCLSALSGFYPLSPPLPSRCNGNLLPLHDPLSSSSRKQKNSKVVGQTGPTRFWSSKAGTPFALFPPKCPFDPSGMNQSSTCVRISSFPHPTPPKSLTFHGRPSDPPPIKSDPGFFLLFLELLPCPVAPYRWSEVILPIPAKHSLSAPRPTSRSPASTFGMSAPFFLGAHSLSPALQKWSST